MSRDVLLIFPLLEIPHFSKYNEALKDLLNLHPRCDFQNEAMMRPTSLQLTGKGVMTMALLGCGRDSVYGPGGMARRDPP